MGRLVALVVVSAWLAAPASAQFTGPSAAPQGAVVTVAAVQGVRVGGYVTVEGNIVAHERGDYFTFQDATGRMRAEIEREIWRGREVTPSTPVRLFAEVDRGFRGRYLSVERLDIGP